MSITIHGHLAGFALYLDEKGVDFRVNENQQIEMIVNKVGAKTTLEDMKELLAMQHMDCTEEKYDEEHVVLRIFNRAH